MFPIQQATMSPHSIALWVDAATGSDLNDGSQAAPLATVVEAARRMPHVTPVDPQNVIITVAAGTYAVPTFLPELMRGQIYIYAPEFNELVAPAVAVAGSSRLQLVTGGGLGVDTYRGKTVEILTGAAAGDRRIIRDHTDTTIIPVVAFSVAIAANDTWRIVEPATTLQGSEWFASPSGPRQVVGSYGDDSDVVTPAINYINLNLDIASIGGGSHVYSYGTMRMYGCEFVRTTIIDGPGMFQFGFDGLARPDNTAQRALTGLVFGAPLDSSWSGWGLNFEGVCVAGQTNIWGVGLVAHGLPCFGTRAWVFGGNLYNGGLNGAVAALAGTNGPTNVVFTGKSYFPDIKAKIAGITGPATRSSGFGAFLFVEQTDIDATGQIGAHVKEHGHLRLFGDADILSSATGVKVETGGIMRFNNGLTIATTGNEFEIGNTPATATIAANFAANKAFVQGLPAGDGSVVQRID